METSIDSLMFILLAKGKPLEGQGGPLEFLHKKAVIQEASIFHPGIKIGVVFWLIILHGANRKDNYYEK